MATATQIKPEIQGNGQPAEVQASYGRAAHPSPNTEIRPTSAPAVDVYESDDEILVVADMPGARPDSVTIKLEKEELFIAANRDTDVNGQVLFGARRDCEYRRAFLVPRGIDATQINAEMSQGVLRVHMPKSAATRPRTIEVKARN